MNRRRPGDPFVFERWTGGDPRLVPIGDLPLSVRTLNRLLMERYWTDHGRASLFSKRGVTRPRSAFYGKPVASHGVGEEVRGCDDWRGTLDLVKS